MKMLSLILALLVGCVGDDEPGLPDAGETDATIAVDAAPDATALPRCADVGCPDVALCTEHGCCTCNATGEPVQCLSRTAEPDACELSP